MTIIVKFIDGSKETYMGVSHYYFDYSDNKWLHIHYGTSTKAIINTDNILSYVIF